MVNKCKTFLKTIFHLAILVLINFHPLKSFWFFITNFLLKIIKRRIWNWQTDFSSPLNWNRRLYRDWTDRQIFSSLKCNCRLYRDWIAHLINMGKESTRIATEGFVFCQMRNFLQITLTFKSSNQQQEIEELLMAAISQKTSHTLFVKTDHFDF